MRVSIFVPCFIDQLYPSVAFHTIKLLEKAGCTVHYNPNQTCCGQPAFNAGFIGEAKSVCMKFMDDFKNDEIIVTPSASCCGFINNHYPALFADSTYSVHAKQIGGRVIELSDFLVNHLQITDFGSELNLTATYHHSCAALRECNIRKEPLILLENVRGLKLKQLKDEETCCGFGGTFAVKFPGISAAMADQKIEDAENTGASTVISTDMSCLMHLEGRAKQHRAPLRFLHLAEVLTSGW